MMKMIAETLFAIGLLLLLAWCLLEHMLGR
jgi:hypothetical protein